MEWALVFGAFTAFAALASGVAWLVRSLWKLSQSFNKLMEEVFGDQLRPEERPGIVVRLHTIETGQADMKDQVDDIKGELYQNHGTSLRDTVERVEAIVNDRRGENEDG